MKKLSFFFSLIVATILSTALVSCGDDDSSDPEPEPQTIAQIAAGDDQFTTLVAALDRVGLVSVLDGTDKFTVFAPTNTAFANAGITSLDGFSDEELTEILLYHVLGGELQSSGIQEGQTYATTATETSPDDTQLSVLVEKAGANVTINGTTNVTTADVVASNGVIHIIDGVLLPPTVVDLAVANSNFSELVGALQAASGNLVDVLSGDGPFTVFAPGNAAFEAIADVTATLDADQLASVLTYHVVPGNIRASEVASGEVTTVNGEILTITVEGNNVTLTDARGNDSVVSFTDVQGTNGVIHVINSVILPNDL